MQCVSDRAGHGTGILILVGGFLLVVGSTPLSCEISGCFLGGQRRRNLGQVFWILGLFGTEGSYLSWSGRWAICANEAAPWGLQESHQPSSTGAIRGENPACSVGAMLMVGRAQSDCARKLQKTTSEFTFKPHRRQRPFLGRSRGIVPWVVRSRILGLFETRDNFPLQNVCTVVISKRHGGHPSGFVPKVVEWYSAVRGWIIRV
jgi:hypothetical protein